MSACAGSVAAALLVDAGGIRVAGTDVTILVGLGDGATVGRVVGLVVAVGSTTIALTGTGVAIDCVGRGVVTGWWLGAGTRAQPNTTNARNNMLAIRITAPAPQTSSAL